MKYGDRNNKKLVEDSIELFHRHWDQLTSNSAGPADRYSCVAELSNVMRKKKGAITDEDCIAWCYIVLVALHAPDSFFSRFSEVDLNASEKIELLEEEIKCYFGYIDSVKEHDSILYPYIKCARELLERLNNRGRKVIKAETKEETGNLSKILHKKFEEELRQRNLDKNASVSKQKFQICSFKLEERYPWLSSALDDIGYFISYPVLFAFLPYYLFMNLAKDEKWLSDRKEPFTCIQLNPNTLRWSIRNSPFKVKDRDDFDSLLSLYRLVKRVLCEDVQEDIPCTTGKLFFNTCRGECGFKQETKKPLNAFSFILLPANIDQWAKVYFMGLVSDPPTLIRKKLTNIFCKINLKSPGAKRPGVRELICAEFGKGVDREFEVWEEGSWQKCGYSPCDIMEALIELYSPGIAQNKSEIENKYNEEKVKAIADFIYIIKGQSLDLQTPTNTEWVNLLLALNDMTGIQLKLTDPYGDDTNEDAQKIYNTLSFNINGDPLVLDPNQMLISRLIKKTIQQTDWVDDDYSKEKHLLDLLKIPDHLIATISSCLVKDSDIIHDIFLWSVIKVSGCKSNLLNQFKVWEFWHPLGRKQNKSYYEICMYFKGNPRYIPNFLDELYHLSKMDSFEIVLPDFTLLPYSVFMSDELLQHKKRVMALFEMFCTSTELEPEELDDIRYLKLLYHLFFAARSNMLRTIYEQMIKFFPFDG